MHRRSPLSRSLVGLLLALVAAVGLPALASPSGAAPADPTTRLIISFQRHARTSNVEQAQAAEDAGEVVRIIPELRTRVIEVPASRAAVTRKRLLGRADVLTVEPDPVVTASLVPNDPSFAAQWAPVKVKLPAAWDTTTGSSSVVIAIVDTGVTPTNPDLPSSKLLTGRNAIYGLNGYTTDDNGHGTASASVAAMIGGNGSRAAGACWACRILPVKVLGSNGSGSASNVAAGIVWAANNGADVISLSLGGSSGTTAQKQAVDYAESKGIPVVAAAGNDNSPLRHYPAAFFPAISVGATDANDNRTSYSNYGPWVLLAAPGTSSALNRTGSVVSFSGTSAATPLVSGVVGLMLTADPTLTPAEIRSILTSTADPADIPLLAGSGRLDAAQAVAEAALSGTTTSSSTSSTSSTSTSSTSSTSTSSSSTSSTTSSTSSTTSSTSSTTSSTSPSSTTTTTAATGPTKVVSGSAYTSWLGVLNRNASVKAGSTTFRATCSNCGSMRLDVLNSSGTVVATRSSTSPNALTATLPAGSYTFRVTSNAVRFVSYTITSPA